MSDPELETHWQRVLDEWDDDKVHGAFLSYCQATRSLGEAARRYRGLADPASPFRDRAERMEAARKRLGAVATLAVLDMQSSKTEVSQPRWIWALRAAAIVIAIVALYAFFRLATR